MQGNLLQKLSLSNEGLKELDLHIIPKGIYFIKVSGTETSVTQKIILQ
jgi:hypothetical protein